MLFGDDGPTELETTEKQHPASTYSHSMTMYRDFLSSNPPPDSLDPTGSYQPQPQFFDQRSHLRHQAPASTVDHYGGALPYNQDMPIENTFSHATPASQLSPMAMPPPYAYAYSPAVAQPWNSGDYPASVAGLPVPNAMTQHPNAGLRGRTAIPSTWLGQGEMAAADSGNNSSPAAGLPTALEDEELILTAIVIKNIPFAVKKEQLAQLMTDLHLPLPYAFNYHFDKGVFRGLAFANFNTAEETAMAIEGLNNYGLHGRRLRVEYKKMLPAQERERIERTKRGRRGQLEEQHHSFATTRKIDNLRSGSPCSSSSSYGTATPSTQQSKLDVNMNDSVTLEFYRQLLLFQHDHSRETYIFPSTLAPAQRRTVHTLARSLGLSHVSHGTSELRQIHISRTPVYPDQGLMGPAQTPMPSMGPSSVQKMMEQRSLIRSATTDLSETRKHNASPPSALRSHSSELSDITDPSTFSFGPTADAQRAVKSFHDLRSYTSSPALPVGLSRDFYQNGSVASTSRVPGTAVRPVSTSVAPTVNISPSRRWKSPTSTDLLNEDLVCESLGNLSLSMATPSSYSSHTNLGNSVSWENANDLPSKLQSNFMPATSSSGPAPSQVRSNENVAAVGWPWSAKKYGSLQQESSRPRTAEIPKGLRHPGGPRVSASVPLSMGQRSRANDEKYGAVNVIDE